MSTLHDIVMTGVEINPALPVLEYLADKFNTQPEIEQLNYKLTLKRHSTFIFLNLVVPIILLSFVNLLVFCIPVASGERGSLAF
jgi:hypothetical protein